MNERPIPEAAKRDQNSVEMLRVWIAEAQLHCSMKIGMYREKMNIAEEKAWGIILADVTRHVATALESAYSGSRENSIRAIRECYFEELSRPTSAAEGEFVNRE
jgi:Domain of unknown function (DUF5076)